MEIIISKISLYKTLLNWAVKPYNIYFRLRLGMVNLIQTYSRLKICFSLKCALIKFAILNLSQFFFVFQKSVKLPFKTRFWVQNNFLNLSSWVVNSQKLFCSKRLVFNINDTAFWFIQIIFICYSKYLLTWT